MKSSKLTEEIQEIKHMCRKNFGGYWELAHLPQSGGFYEQPAPDLEKIMKIIDYINLAIYNQKDDKK